MWWFVDNIWKAVKFWIYENNIKFIFCVDLESLYYSDLNLRDSVTTNLGYILFLKST